MKLQKLKSTINRLIKDFFEETDKLSKNKEFEELFSSFLKHVEKFKKEIDYETSKYLLKYMNKKAEEFNNYDMFGEYYKVILAAVNGGKYEN